MVEVGGVVVSLHSVATFLREEAEWKKTMASCVPEKYKTSPFVPSNYDDI